MLISFHPEINHRSREVAAFFDFLRRFPSITAQLPPPAFGGGGRVEVLLSGELAALPSRELERMAGVRSVISLAEKYRLIGRHQGDLGTFGFCYKGVHFDEETLHVFPGLCAVDERKNVARMMQCLSEHGIVTTRMGAYKPRTSPYDFQGHGRDCLAYVFELAGLHGIQVIAMEVLRESHLDEIREALRLAGNPTGVMLQIGTRNAQNFELLKHVGQQLDFPVLYKRGMGITLEESLNACEYIASEGNRNIIFCLRGVKTHLGDPHRNLVDFAHVPVVRRLTRLLVCVDPSHAVGKRDVGPDHLSDLRHATAQGVIAGANMVLVDFHPEPARALCDGPQALTLEELSSFLADVAIARAAYCRRRSLHEAQTPQATPTAWAQLGTEAGTDAGSHSRPYGLRCCRGCCRGGRRVRVFHRAVFNLRQPLCYRGPRQRGGIHA